MAGFWIEAQCMYRRGCEKKRGAEAIVLCSVSERPSRHEDSLVWLTMKVVYPLPYAYSWFRGVVVDLRTSRRRHRHSRIEPKLGPITLDPCRRAWAWQLHTLQLQAQQLQSYFH
jgi:hypothetical protein